MAGKKHKKRPHSALHRWWIAYEYKHTTGAIIGVILFVTLLDSALLTAVFNFFESTGYVGGFIAGVLSASFFTAVPALVVVVDLAGQLDHLPLAMMVGLGNAVGDMILLLFFEERVFGELRPLFKKLHIAKRFKRMKRGRRTLALLGGVFFLISPLPDEIGLSLLGISHFPKPVLLAICWGLNTLGASAVILVATSI
jgi:hypothetical protein